MFNRCEIITYQNKLFYVYRKIKEYIVKEDIRNELREYWNCDMIVKNNKDPENLWFLREISDAEIIE